MLSLNKADVEEVYIYVGRKFMFADRKCSQDKCVSTVQGLYTLATALLANTAIHPYNGVEQQTDTANATYV